MNISSTVSKLQSENDSVQNLSTHMSERIIITQKIVLKIFTKKINTVLLMAASSFPLNSNTEKTAPFTSLLEICTSFPKINIIIK